MTYRDKTKFKLLAFLLAITILSGMFFIVNTVDTEAMTVSQIEESLTNLMTNDGFRPGRPGFITGSGICYKFLNYVVNKLFGHSLPTQQPSKYALHPNSDWTQVGGTICNDKRNLSVSSLKSLFQQAQAGDVVQMHYSYGNYGYHTAIVYKVTSEGVILYSAGSGTVHLGAGPMMPTVEQSKYSVMWGTKGDVLTYQAYYDVYLKGSADGLSIYRSTKAASAAKPDIPKVEFKGDPTYNSTWADDYSVPTTTIREKSPSMEGFDVAWIQAVLLNLEYKPMTIDGKYGKQSITAVKNFQTDTGLTADGVVGPQTLSMLKSWWNEYKYSEKVPDKTKPTATLNPSSTATPKPSITPTPTPAAKYGVVNGYNMPTETIKLTSPATQGEGVRWIQSLLKDLGYVKNIDGDFGPLTQDSVIQFQKAYGLAADGSVGPATRTKMYEAWCKKMGVNPSPTNTPAPTPTPKPSPTPTPAPSSAGIVNGYPMPTVSVKRGSTGNAVKWVQSVLNDLGYNMVVDGSFGAGTESKVKAFQNDQKLTADGSVGPATRTKMYEAWQNKKATPTPSPKPTPTPTPSSTGTVNGYSMPTVSVRQGSTGNNVKWVQSVLKDLGFSITVDGDFGNTTATRVREFQSKYGLAVDGSVGAGTRTKMYEEWLKKKATPAPTATPAPGGSNSLNPDDHAVPTESLRLGASCDGVKWVQCILAKLGYSVTVDGSFGQKSYEAVLRFQRENGLTADGSVGPATRSKLQAKWDAYKEAQKPKNPYAEPTESLRLGARGDGVKWVQTILNTLGYNLVVDGDFGQTTFGKVKEFQREYKLDVDGNVGPATRAKLKECWNKKVG